MSIALMLQCNHIMQNVCAQEGWIQLQTAAQNVSTIHLTFSYPSITIAVRWL